ncbi:MAG: hypothetical protein IKN16_06805 [Selenomonadaceae bacterium]|nr:hypothetical protein [Selenomonadaceae bacterium]
MYKIFARKNRCAFTQRLRKFFVCFVDVHFSNHLQKFSRFKLPREQPRQAGRREERERHIFHLLSKHAVNISHEATTTATIRPCNSSPFKAKLLTRQVDGYAINITSKIVATQELFAAREDGNCSGCAGGECGDSFGGGGGEQRCQEEHTQQLLSATYYQLGGDFANHFSRELDLIGIGSFRYSVFKDSLGRGASLTL